MKGRPSGDSFQQRRVGGVTTRRQQVYLVEQISWVVVLLREVTVQSPPVGWC